MECFSRDVSNREELVGRTTEQRQWTFKKWASMKSELVGMILQETSLRGREFMRAGSFLKKQY